MESDQERPSWCPAQGQLTYLQIPTTDLGASSRFYSAVFGWSVEPGTSSFEAPGLIGQWATDRPPSADAGFLIWISVKEIDAAIDAAIANGGLVIDPPFLDDTRRLATIRDPSGNTVGIVQDDIQTS